MADDEGLPPPPPPIRPTMVIDRATDVAPGEVKQGLGDIVNEVFGDRAAQAAPPSGTPTFKPFSSNGAAGLQPVQSTAERAVDPDSPEVALAKFLGTTLINPITSIVDQYEVSKIRAAQQKFLEDNGENLDKLSRLMGRSKRAMRDLSEWLSKQHIPATDARGLLDQKAAVGTQERIRLEDGIKEATDPSERARLQALKENFDKWIKERDARLVPEKIEQAQLEDRIDKLNREISTRQADAFNDAAYSNGPRTETSNGKVTASAETQPQALEHAASLLDFLVGERQQLISAVKGR
jgi:hypothetical protein